MNSAEERVWVVGLINPPEKKSLGGKVDRVIKVQSCDDKVDSMNAYTIRNGCNRND